MANNGSMGQVEFKRALLALNACMDARNRLRTQTLRQFWSSTDRTDWMVWLAIRAGFWTKVKPVAVKHLLYHDLCAISKHIGRGRRHYAANNSCYMPYNNKSIADEIRARVSWQEVVASMRRRLNAERRRA